MINLYKIDNKSNKGESLTKRQIEVLKYVLLGYTAKKIALYLGISFRTVETYIEILKLKFQCGSKGELIENSIKTGLINKIFNDPSLYKVNIKL